MSNFHFKTSHDFFKDTSDLVLFLRKALRPMFIKHECDFAYLVGSWARGRALPWSDVDVFVSIPRTRSLSQKERLSLLLSLNAEAEKLANFTDLDVRVLELLPLHVQMNALRDGIVLFEANDYSRFAYLEHLIKVHNDHVIWYRKLLRERLKLLKGKKAT